MKALRQVRELVFTSAWWGFWGFMASAFLTASVLIWLSRAPTMQVLSLHEVDGIAVRGGAIDLLATINRNRTCPSTIDRWLWRWSNLPDGDRVQQWVWLGAPRSPPTPMGGNQYMLSIQLPANVTDGLWYYVGIANDNCSVLPAIFRSLPRRTPDVPITVSNPTAESPGTVILPPAPFEAVPETK